MNGDERMDAYLLGRVMAVLAEYCPKLRDSGVTRVAVEGVVVDIAQKTEDLIPQIRDEMPAVHPLDDPATFGGVIPSLRRPRSNE